MRYGIYFVLDRRDNNRDNDRRDRRDDTRRGERRDYDRDDTRDKDKRRDDHRGERPREPDSKLHNERAGERETTERSPRQSVSDSLCLCTTPVINRCRIILKLFQFHLHRLPLHHDRIWILTHRMTSVKRVKKWMRLTTTPRLWPLSWAFKALEVPRYESFVQSLCVRARCDIVCRANQSKVTKKELLT